MQTKQVADFLLVIEHELIDSVVKVAFGDGIALRLGYLPAS